MNWGTLTNYIYKVIEETKLVHSSCAFSRVFIEEIKVIGENGLNLLRDVAKTGFSMFVRTALIVMPTTFLVATIVLYVL